MIKSKNMTKRFISSFIVFIVIPFLCVSIVINILYKKILISHYNEKVQQIMEQMSTDIDTELRRISLYAAKIANDRDLLYCVNDWYNENDIIKKLEKYKKIEEKLDYLFAYQGEINSILFFSNDSQVFNYGNNFYIDKYVVKESVWYKECIKNKDKVYSINNLKTNNEEKDNRIKFLVGISPSTSYFNTGIDFIYLEIKTDVVKSICSRFKNDSVGKMIIIDSSGNIVVSPEKNLLGRKYSEINYVNKIVSSNNNFYKTNLNTGMKYVSKYTSENSDWIIINIIDYNSLLNAANNIIKFTIIILVIFIALFILYSKIFFRDLISPIKKLINKMSSVKQGKFDGVVCTKSNIYEVVELESNYNKMIADIKILMKERDVKERERSKEEIKALQAQINPHFIYNTLNLIKLMAMISKADNIRKVTDSFMKLLSATFKSQSTFITLKEELDYLDNYTEIMKVRFGEDFNVKVNVDEELKNIYVIKLILQPIVENAIIHGINTLESNKSIVINGYVEENKLIVEVEDNGVGMSQDEIDNVLQDKDENKASSQGIGIRNVLRRIKLNCGDQYGIKIESEKNKFTKVKLILPIKKAVN